jgi:ATP-dependent Lhr-like helicase
MVWVGAGAPSAHDEAPVLANIRMIRRGTGRAWLPESHPPIGEAATATLEAMTRLGAVFFDELLAETSFSSRKLRDALRELVGAGLATNDTIDAMRAVVRWRPLVSPRERSRPDPTRWLPADFSPSANRYVVQRRPNLRRLPRWQRPDLPGGESDAWPGRWSLVTSPRVLGGSAPNDEVAFAEAIARQWLDRYGVVAREIWRRERPMIPWRSVYRELKRLEFRGDVRRGYFVRGLSGAQFALPEAIEALRSDDAGDEAVVVAAADPANVFSLPIPGDPARDPFVRPRSSSALLVAIGGRVVLIAERRGSRVVVRPDSDEGMVARAAEALVRHLSSRLRRDLVLETIDGQPAAASPQASAFEKAGFRRGRTELRYLRPTR